MPMPHVKATVIVPCYNEEQRLPKEQYLDFANTTQGYHFLFVDDGSKDNTFQILDGLRKERPDRFSLLKLERNWGKAEAVRRGFLEAMRSEPDFLAYWDADLATPLNVLPSFMALFHEWPMVEMVFGSRVKLMGRDIQRHAIRHYLGRVFATAASIVLGLGVYDTQCGAKMFRNTEMLRVILETPFQSKWIFDVELIARFVQAKKKAGESNAASAIYELPLPAWYDVAGSKVKATDFFKAFGELVQIYRTYR